MNRAWLARSGALAASSGVLFFGATAQAGQPEYHDDFQFRGAAGIGYLSDSEPGNASLHGAAFSLEAYLGAMPARGLAVGGFLSLVSAVGPSLSVPNIGSLSARDASVTLFTIGPYIDFYPNPHGGLHILGTVGFADLTASYSDGNFSANDSASGFAIGGGVGYDWWVSADWSIGILGRVTFASTSRNSESESTIAPTVLFSFSYN